MVSGVLIALAVVGIFVRQDVEQGKDIRTLRERVTVVEADNPCNNLSTRECALKLFRSLSKEEQSEIEKRVVAELRREARRQALQRQKAQRRFENSENDPSNPPVVPPVPPVIPPENPQNPPPDKPDNPRKPLVRTPTIDPPPVGPYDPEPIPGIEIYCPMTTPIIQC